MKENEKLFFQKEPDFQFFQTALFRLRFIVFILEKFMFQIFPQLSHFKIKTGGSKPVW